MGVAELFGGWLVVFEIAGGIAGDAHDLFVNIVIGSDGFGGDRGTVAFEAFLFCFGIHKGRGGGEEGGDRVFACVFVDELVLHIGGAPLGELHQERKEGFLIVPAGGFVVGDVAEIVQEFFAAVFVFAKAGFDGHANVGKL